MTVARIERNWIERLQLDAEKLGLVVVDDPPDEDDVEGEDDLLRDDAAYSPDDADR